LPEYTYAAFTVAELGEMLPERWSAVHLFEKSRAFHVRDGNDKGESIADMGTDALSEADARAKMLTHLLEKKLIASAAQSV